MKIPQQYHLIYGDGSSMEIIRNGEVDMVLTSPPYFGSNTELLLKQPKKEQTEVLRVREELTAFALSLRPVYEEIGRILRPGGILALQVKDVTYGGFQSPVCSMHREMAESTGLMLLTRTFWHKFKRRSASNNFLKNPRVGSFCADEVEEIMIFSDLSNKYAKRPLVDLPMEEIRASTNPIWTFAPASGTSRVHPYQSPDGLVRRLIGLYTVPGDLVVDPFAGAGTTLSSAFKMDRRAIGYEIDKRTAEVADSAIKRSIGKKETASS
jgi:DNA modification methylase